MTDRTNTIAEAKKTPSQSRGQIFELNDKDLEVVVGGINPQPLPPKHNT
jgi:hypothetical protein